MLIDTHAHLLDPSFDHDREAVLARAAAADVRRIVEIADGPDAWGPVLSFVESHPPMRCALGLHPYCAEAWSTELASRLRGCAHSPAVVAVGEIGLDYAKCRVPRPTQKAAFLGMLETARELDLPVSIHSRDAFPDTLDILEDFYRTEALASRFRGVLHCFSGGKAEALRGVSLGFALGVDGPVSYPKNDALREALQAAGLENLVLETDCPYLPPQPLRGKRNEPSAVVEIARALAAALGKSEAEVAEATSANARGLYRLS